MDIGGPTDDDENESKEDKDAHKAATQERDRAATAAKQYEEEMARLRRRHEKDEVKVRELKTRKHKKCGFTCKIMVGPSSTFSLPSLNGSPLTNSREPPLHSQKYLRSK